MKSIIKKFISIAEENALIEDIFNHLSQEVSFDIAFKICHLTPILAARYLLRDLGVTFQNNYLILDRNGEIAERGNIQDNNDIMNALRTFEFTPQEAKKIMFRSSEVSALNDLINSGNNPEDLLMSPPVMFCEEPTEAGLIKAEKIIKENF